MTAMTGGGSILLTLGVRLASISGFLAMDMLAVLMTI
jgi:hypothetical protein